MFLDQNSHHYDIDCLMLLYFGSTGYYRLALCGQFAFRWYNRARLKQKMSLRTTG